MKAPTPNRLGSQADSLDASSGGRHARARPGTVAIIVTSRRQRKSMEHLVKALGVDPMNFALAQQMAAAVRDQWRRLQKALRRCLRAFSDEAVHDTRVSCRRLIARLTLIRAAMGDPAVDPLLRTLKRLLKSLGELRDVQVQKLAMTDDLSVHPAIASLWMELAHREDDLIKVGSVSVARFKTGKLDRILQTLCAGLEDPVIQLGAKATLRDATVRAIRVTYDEVLRRREAIVASRPATVHRVRVAYKKFRYMVESLPPALGTVSPSQLSAMADQQKAMGDIQDVEVRLRMVENHARKHPLTAEGLDPYRRALLAQRRALVQSFIDQADGLVRLWPECLPVPVTLSSRRTPAPSTHDLAPQLKASA